MKNKVSGLPSDTMVREAVLQIAPYQPGKPMEEVARELGLKDIIKMASNENPLGPSPRALKAIAATMDKIHLYPDGGGYRLKGKLAEKFGLDRACFTLGNGSSDILAFVLWVFIRPGDEVLTAQSTFLMYPILARIAHARLVEVPLKNWCFDLAAMAQRITPKTKVVFLCNPNNPTGTVVRREEMQAFLKRVPQDVVVVLDEAYIEFVDDPEVPDGVELLRAHPNVVVLRTFSKIVGLAGLRIGYGISHPRVADWLNRVRPPFNTNVMAQAAATAALDDRAHIAKTKRIVREGRKFLAQAFDGLGLPHIPTWTNYMMVCVKGRGRDGDSVFDDLLKSGVIVRSMKAYGFPEYIRVSIGTMAQNKRLIHALRKMCISLASCHSEAKPKNLSL